MAAALVVHLLGLVGTPPAVVFVGKLLAFSTAAEAGLTWLVVVGASTRSRAGTDYLRWLGPVYDRSAPERTVDGDRAPTVVAIGAAGLVILAGIASGVVVLVP